MTKVPIVDVSALCEPADGERSDSRHEAARQLYVALSEIGFACVVGHGVPVQVVERTRAAVRSLFDAPREVLAEQTVERGNYRGYVPLGYFTPNSGVGEADEYEAWKLHAQTPADAPVCAASDLYGPNRWPGIDADIKTPVMEYWAQMDRVNTLLLTALWRQLGLDVSYVLGCLRDPLTNMTLLNYPPASGPGSWGIHPHKDFNVLTLLAHAPVGGLEVRNRDGDWLSAACPEHGLVVNVGDMLELWSGGRLVSTPHRVVNRSGRRRQSFPYFSVPRHDVTIEPLLPRLPGFARPPLHVGRSSADIWYSNWPGTASSDPAQDLGNFAG